MWPALSNQARCTSQTKCKTRIFCIMHSWLSKGCLNVLFSFEETYISFFSLLVSPLDSENLNIKRCIQQKRRSVYEGLASVPASGMSVEVRSVLVTLAGLVLW